MEIKMKKIPFGKPDFSSKEYNEIKDCLKKSWVGTGPKTNFFENNFKKFKKTKYAIALSSCTAALHLSLLALGIKKGDEVITTSMTFCSTINSIIHSGAKPILIDIQNDTLNFNEHEIEKKITKKTKCILVVHFAGLPCNMKQVLKISNKYKLRVIEDCAHSVEASLDNKSMGTFGDTGCFSFYANKNLSTGEGGMVVTNNKEIEKKIRTLSLHGLSKDAWKRFSNSKFSTYDVLEAGYKYNMSDMQSSLGIHQLKNINKKLKIRKRIWKKYSEGLANLSITIPPKNFTKKIKHSYHLYTIRVPNLAKFNRNILAKELQKKGVVTGIHYKSIADFNYYKKILKLKKKDFINSINYGRQTLSLPIYPSLKNHEQIFIIKSIKKILKKYNV